MEESKKITVEVTPNLQKCLEEWREALKSLAEGDLKTRAKGALDYLTNTFAGELQPMEGKSCPPGKLIVKA